MVIGFDGSRAFTNQRTGTENYSFYLLKNLAQLDADNEYLVYIRQGSKLGYFNWPENFKFKILDYKLLWTQIGLSIATFKDDLDLLFVPAHTLPLIRKPNLKTIVTVHDLGAEFLPTMHQLKQLLYLKLMSHYQLKTATKIIAVSEATKDDLVEKIGIAAKKISVIYEGVDKSLFTNTKSNTENNILNKFNIQSNKYFLHVGTIQPRKNLVRIIEAFSLFLDLNKNTQDLKLVLVGSKGWNNQNIYDLPEKLGISSQVKFLGRVDDEDLSTLYRNCIGLIFPSLFEGFGLPILEAFASGCPVLTSNISSMPEIASDAAILVDPKSVKEIMEGMLKLTTNKAFKDKLIEKGFARLKFFSWEKTAKNTLELFKEVINGQS